MMKKRNNKIGIFGVIGCVLLVLTVLLIIFQPTSSGIYLVISSTLSLVTFWIDRLKNHNTTSVIGQYLALVIFIFAIVLYVVYLNMK